MSENYELLVQFGDDLIPMLVSKHGTFRDLKRAYQDLFDVPVNKQVYGGRIGELGVDDDFPLAGMGLENAEPLSVFASGPSDGGASSRFPPDTAPNAFSNDFFTGETGNISPRTAAAIAASLDTPHKPPMHLPDGSREAPFAVDDSDGYERLLTSDDHPIDVDDDSAFIDDFHEISGPQRVGAPIGMGMDLSRAGVRGPSPVPVRSPPSGSVWNDTSSLVDRMNEMMDGPGFGMRAPVGGRTGEVLGYLSPGNFIPMHITGREKTSFLQLINENVVLPNTWRLAFPSRAMGNASPLQYPNEKIEDAISDAHQMNHFVALHIFNSAQSESSDFYNMIVSVDSVQSIYADNFVSYYCNINKPIEISALSRLLSPSQARAPTIQLPVVFLLATMKGRLHILGCADSTLTAPEYIDKLIMTRETYAPQIAEDKLLDEERRSQTTLVDEQNSAYELSQRQDQERAAMEEAEQQKIRQAEQQRELKEATERQLAQDQEMINASMRTFTRTQYLDEFAKLPAEPTTGRNTTIQLRLTDGSKVQRKFDTETARLSDVFTFAAGIVAQRSTDETFKDPSHPDQPWSIDHFALSSQFPKRQFLHSEANKTLKELELGGQQVLHLENIK